MRHKNRLCPRLDPRESGVELDAFHGVGCELIYQEKVSGHCHVIKPECIQCELIYQEKVSGASANCPKLDKLWSRLHPGDAVYIYKLDRRGYSLPHFLTVVADLQRSGVGLMSLTARQRELVSRLLDGFTGKLTSSQWAAIAKFSQDTATRDIQALLHLGILEKAAGGRSTSYRLAMVA